MNPLQRLVAIDEWLLVSIARWRLPSATRVMATFTRLGDASSWAFLCLLLIALGESARALGIHLGVATLAATVLVQPVKRACRRSRPSARGFKALVENPDTFSFPSGHTAAAVAAAVASLAVCPSVAVMLFTFAAFVAASRVYLGAHYPLDVLVGAVLGAAAGAFGAATL